MHRLHHIDLIFLLNEKVEYKRGVAQPEHVANLSGRLCLYSHHYLLYHFGIMYMFVFKLLNTYLVRVRRIFGRILRKP